MLKGRWSVRPKIAVRIEKARDFILRFRRTPSVGLPFGGQRKMQAEVGIGMSFRVVGNLGEPGAGNHDAGRSGGAFVERVKAGRIFGVSDRKVIGMDDKQLGIRW